jgi:hypothetical protein
LEQAGLVSQQSRQRLDSTQMFGRVSKMNRLDCVRESLRLALREVAPGVTEAARPAWWNVLWDRYVESQADYRASSETLSRKLAEAGTDAQRLLEWLREQPEGLAQGEQARLLARVFGEQFEVKAGHAAPQPKSQEPVAAVADFQIQVEERRAVCPAGKVSTQCSRLEAAATGKVDYRFEFSTQCHERVGTGARFAPGQVSRLGQSETAKLLYRRGL